MRLPGRAQAEPVQASSPKVDGKEQIAALIRRDYPFMSEDCIRQVLNEM
ncbi:hypothetical protein SEA_WENTWORTH_85 [Streptomyces phage Wentworth]|nr:hypothetical protein SEA_WENTWORTH_85 [Streptomyces phage Wentworth]